MGSASSFAYRAAHNGFLNVGCEFVDNLLHDDVGKARRSIRAATFIGNRHRRTRTASGR